VKSRTWNLPSKRLICLALGLITVAVFAPNLTHNFLGYDDQQYVTENAQVQAGLTGHGMVWAFGRHAGNWHPLTWLSHMLDCQLYGLKPAGHHLTNVLLHVANTLLLFLVLNRMTGALWRSALVAALFAWHPLHVESVAWVAERKDVLSTLFFLLVLWAYGRYAETRRPKAEGRSQKPTPDLQPHASRITYHALLYYLLSLCLFALGLMSKPMVVTLPFVLLLLDYWPLRRLQLNTHGLTAKTLLPLVWEKAPFFALAVVDCVLTITAQQPAMVSTAGLRISQRLEHALVAYAHYLGALFVPRNLAVYYPYEKVVPVAEVFLAGLVLAAVSALALRHGARRPYLATGWLWFLGMLVPVIGLVQVGDQAWADRYTYLPSVGLFVAVVWGVAELAGKAPAGRGFLRWLAATVSLALLFGTSAQLRYWKDTRTLFEHAARVTHHNPLAITLLGSLLAQEDKIEQAVEYYRTALRYAPGFPEAEFYLGRAFDQQGNLDEAIAEYNKALWFKPFQEQAHIFLGIALAKQGKLDQATAHYLAAIKLNGGESAVAHNNLAKLLHTQGRLDDAIAHYSAALESAPGLAQAHNNLGILLLQQGRLVEGTAHLREALRLKPGDPESQVNLAQALAQQHQWAEAADLFAKTVTAATADPHVHCQFAVTLAHLQRTREAMSHYASALLLQPDLVAALDGLSWILATDANPAFRNSVEAVRMAERACELTGRKDAAKLKTLAAAYAEAGRFPEAAATAQTAIELAAQASSNELANECLLMLEQFKAAKPWRQRSDLKKSS
jgi:tetratricopeptide (TPR) repeat protein